jgi:Ca2+-binding RTX toxin-like protein
VVGQAYAGPVADLQNEYINITPDNLNVTAATPNWFIHSGSGDDAIAVSSGTNVLDGGTGSNFLTGGSGTDTFFVDNRNATADTWNTVVNFHAGDAVTIWGVTPDDFNFDFQDKQGATGFKGLTLHATAPGRPIASVTFAGLTTADLSNGRISESSGTDPVSGSTYTYFHANV